MKLSIISDVARSPAFAAPLMSGLSIANLITILPVLINVATAIYLSMLIAHKSWSWWKEAHGKAPIDTTDDLP